MFFFQHALHYRLSVTDIHCTVVVFDNQKHHHSFPEKEAIKLGTKSIVKKLFLQNI